MTSLVKFCISTFLVIFLIPLKSFAFGFGFDFKEEKKRDYIHIVGSSTISPFMAAVSEEFARNKNLQNTPIITPVVESTGTRAGFKSFCAGVGYEYPDFVDASRHITQDELADCEINGVKDVVEVMIGYDGIVIADSKFNKKTSLSKEQIFLALAEKVYDKKTAKLIDNPYKTWDQIDARLPKREIIFYGPPLGSGTRDIFVDVVMEEICMSRKEFIVQYRDHDSRKAQCKKIRNDGRYVESGENDDLIVNNLKNNHQAFGIFGFHFVAVNKGDIQAARINNINPDYKNIALRKYDLSRPLFVYLKKDHLKLMPQINDFIKELLSAETVGKKGYLVHSGLISMSDAELEKARKAVLSQL